MGVVAGSPATTAITFSIADDGTGSRQSADYLYLWGKQIETDELTSHIVNNASTGTVTRSADVASSTAYTRAADNIKMYHINNSDWFDEDGGTFNIHFTGGNGYISNILNLHNNDGSSTNVIHLLRNSVAATPTTQMRFVNLRCKWIE